MYPVSAIEVWILTVYLIKSFKKKKKIIVLFTWWTSAYFCVCVCVFRSEKIHNLLSLLI